MFYECGVASVSLPDEGATTSPSDRVPAEVARSSLGMDGVGSGSAAGRPCQRRRR